MKKSTLEPFYEAIRSAMAAYGFAPLAREVYSLDLAQGVTGTVWLNHGKAIPGELKVLQQMGVAAPTNIPWGGH